MGEIQRAPFFAFSFSRGFTETEEREGNANKGRTEVGWDRMEWNGCNGVFEVFFRGFREEEKGGAFGR